MIGNSTDGSTVSGAVDVAFGASIHAHPYDFKQTAAVDNGGGVLKMSYSWKSTSGSPSQIPAGSKVYEHLDYTNGAPPAPAGTTGVISTPPPPRSYYQPSVPPFTTGWRVYSPTDPILYPMDQPYVIYFAGSAASFSDYHSPMPVGAPAFTKSSGIYTYGSFVANQEYRFYCSDVNCSDHVTPTVVVGANATNAIVRKVTPNANPATAVYTTLKNGAMATLNLN